MNKNFVIDNAVGIKSEENLYDLHNFYDFTELKVNIKDNALSLLFSIRAAFDKEKKYGSKELSIIFLHVNYFEFSKDFFSKLTHDLEEMGYKNPDDKDVDWLISEEKSTKADHILFRFANDEFLRIYARNAHFSILR